MRSQILRDIVAGCAGALLVLALIGLPDHSTSSGAVAPGRHYKLLPDFNSRAELMPCLFTNLKQVADPHLTPCYTPVKPPRPAPVPSP